jgi:hypothetical protein
MTAAVSLNMVKRGKCAKSSLQHLSGKCVCFTIIEKKVTAQQYLEAITAH